MEKKNGLVQLVSKIYKQKPWNRAVTTIAAVIIFVTTYMLILPAITMTGDPICGMEEHIHSADCYTMVEHRELICPYADSPLTIVHKHDDSCYRDGILVCPLKEVEAHTHTAECYGGVLPADLPGSVSDSPFADGAVISAGQDIGLSGVAGNPSAPLAESFGSVPGAVPAAVPAAGGDPAFTGQILPGDGNPAAAAVEEPLPPCGKKEVVLHSHEVACYDPAGQLICTRPEVIEHQHTDACFLITYEEVLTCTLPEHQHTDACYEKQEEMTVPSEDGMLMPAESSLAQSEMENAGASQGVLQEELAGWGNDSSFTEWGNSFPAEDGGTETFSEPDPDQPPLLNEDQGVSFYLVPQDPGAETDTIASPDESQTESPAESPAGESPAANGEALNADGISADGQVLFELPAEGQTAVEGEPSLPMNPEILEEIPPEILEEDMPQILEENSPQEDPSETNDQDIFIEEITESASMPEQEPADLPQEESALSGEEKTEDADKAEVTEENPADLPEEMVEEVMEEDAEESADQAAGTRENGEAVIEQSVEWVTERFAEQTTEGALAEADLSEAALIPEQIAEAVTEQATSSWLDVGNVIEPAAESVTENTAEQATESTADTAVEQAAESVTESAAEQATESMAESAIEQVTESMAEGVTEQAAESVTESAAEQATESMAEGADEQAAESVTENVAEQATESMAEGAVELATEAIAESVTEQATESVTENAAGQATESVTEYAAEQATEWMTEGATEQATEWMTEGATEQATEWMTEGTTEQTTEWMTEGATEQTTEAAAQWTTEGETEQTTETENETTTSVLEYEGPDYKVRLTCFPSSGIPQGARVEAEEILPGDEEGLYETYLAGAKKALGLDENMKLPEKYARFFDIRILDKNGNEIEPTGPVKVEILYDEPVEGVGEDSPSANVLHFDDASKEAQVLTPLEQRENAEENLNGVSADGAPSALEGEETAADEESHGSAQQDEALTDAETGYVSGQTTQEIPYEMRQESSVEFTTDGFSVYGVVYTVDFYWEVNGSMYEYTLPGGGFVSFQKLVEILGIANNDTNSSSDAENEENSDAQLPIEETEVDNQNDLGGNEVHLTEEADNSRIENYIQNDVTISEDTRKFVADVMNVEFSNPELVWVGKVDAPTTVSGLKESNALEVQYSAELTEEQISQINAQMVEAGDWALISMLPFRSTESLTVTMKTGEVFEIRVTDYQLKKTVMDVRGDTWDITVTYDATAEIPDGAELRVHEITEEDEAYNELQKNVANLKEGAENIPAHPVLFDISIWADGEEVEPAEGSEVRVEIQLARERAKGIFTDEESLLLINDAPVQVENGYVEQTMKVIHQSQDAELNVMDTLSNIADESAMATFTTDSFSNWLVFLDEEATAITIGRNDTIVLRPYKQWSWTGDQGDDWVNPTTAVNEIATVTLRNIEDTNLHQTYDIYEIKPINTGTFVITTEKGKKITVTVQETSPEATKPTPISTVDNSDEGITFNLYDYDQSQNLDEYNNQAAYWNKRNQNSTYPRYEEASLNTGHALKFLGWGYSGSYDSTKWKGDWAKNGILDYTGTTVSPDIVKSDLVTATNGDGRLVPALKDFNENLGYLFNTNAAFNTTNGAVQAYPNANGLFQKGANGYYYYNSNSNYAWYNPQTNAFEVYPHTYQQHTDKNPAGNGKPIGFLPFHQWEPKTDTDGTHGTVGMNHNKYLNHHLGMDMAVEFAIPEDGLDEYGNPITFDFSGDDDLWVFVDDKLVLDVGGLHQPVTASINFSNEVVKVNGQPDTTISEMFSKSTSSDKTWTTGENVPHTLKVFYLERGGCDSNLSIRFNMPTILGKGTLKVVKRPGVNGDNTPLKGAKFGLYSSERCDQEHFLQELTTGDDGTIQFDELAFKDTNTTYYLMELKAPTGYQLDNNVYKVKARINSSTGKAVKDSNGKLLLDVYGPDDTRLEDDTIVNGSIIFPDDTIEKLDIPAEKIWANGITEDAQVTLTIKRYKLIDMTKGLYILQDLKNMPDGYSFQADYTITFPDGSTRLVDYSQFSAGVYFVPNAPVGNYTVEQNIRSTVPENYDWAHNPFNYRLTATLNEDNASTAQFMTTFTPKTGTLHLSSRLVPNGADVSFTPVRYAILDSKGRKVASTTYDEIENGKNFTLPVGTYSVKAVNVPADEAGIKAIHTVQKNNDDPITGISLGNIVITEGAVTNVVFKSVYESYLANSYFKVMDRYQNTTYLTIDLTNTNEKNGTNHKTYKVGDSVTAKVFISKQHVHYDSSSSNSPQASSDDTSTVTFNKTGEDNNNYIFEVTFTAKSNNTVYFKINGSDKNTSQTASSWYETWSNTGSRSMRMLAAPRAANMNTDSLSMNNPLADTPPTPPANQKYVKDNEWFTTVSLNNGKNWRDTITNLEATDTYGNRYYYYVAGVDETNLDPRAVNECSFEDQDGKLLMIGKDCNDDTSFALRITNKTYRFGSLAITKTVTINDQDSRSNLMDGEYIFHIVGADQNTSNQEHWVKIHFTKGRADWTQVDSGEVQYVYGMNNSWQVVLKDLPVGDYTVTETNQPTGMTLKTISGGKNGTVNMDESTVTATVTVVPGDGAPTTGAALVGFTNDREETININVKKKWLPAPTGNASVTLELHRYARKSRGALSLVLRDKADGTPIEGAEFTLYKDDTATTDTYTTDSFGRIGINELEPGHWYQLKQTAASYGYEYSALNPPQTEILMVQDNTLTAQSLPEAQLTNAKKIPKGEITLTLTQSNVGSGDGRTPIQGASFDLYKADGTLVSENIETGENGKLIVSDLPADSYYFVQRSTISQYKLPDTSNHIGFEVTNTNPDQVQEITLSTTNDLMGYGKITVILKKDTTNGAPVTGATFQLWQGSIYKGAVSTDANGQAVFTDVPEGNYTVKQIDVGDAGQNYRLDEKNDKPVEIQVSVLNDTPSVSFVTTRPAGDVTIRLWKHQKGAQTNWVLMDTIEHLQPNQAYSFAAQIDEGLYDNHQAFFFWDTGTAQYIEWENNSQFTHHRNDNTPAETQLSMLNTSGWASGYYSFSFTPEQDNTVYNLVLVSGWGVDSITSFSMISSRTKTLNASAVPQTVNAPSTLSIGWKAPVRLNAAPKTAPAVTTANTTPPECPPDYMEDSSFTIVKTFSNAGDGTADEWICTFAPQDKYDANGYLYYYYVLERSWTPENYQSIHTPSLLTESGDVVITNATGGDLELTKQVAGNGDNEKTFVFEIELTAPSGGTLADSYKAIHTGDNNITSVSISSGKISGINLKANETITIKDLPAGTTYKITENDYSEDGYSSNLPANGLDGTIRGGGIARESVEVTNTLSAGNLTVEKTLAGNAAESNKEFSFTVTFNMARLSGDAGTFKKGTADTIESIPGQVITFNNGAVTIDFSLRGGEKAEFIGLPTGTTFTVTETSKDSDGYETIVSSAGGTVNPNKTVTGKISKTIAVTASYVNRKETTSAYAAKAWKSGGQTITWPEDVASVGFTLYKTVNNKESKVTASDLTDYMENPSDFVNPIQVTSSMTDLKAVWNNLPARILESGTWYDVTYSVKETSVSYTAAAKKADKDLTDLTTEEAISAVYGTPDYDSTSHTFTNEIPRTTIAAKKQWKDKDGNNLTGNSIPDDATVTFELFIVTGSQETEQNKKVVLDGKTIDEDIAAIRADENKTYEEKEAAIAALEETAYGEFTAWEAEWKDLPAYNNDGSKITYLVKETETFPGYENQSPDGVSSGKTIINKEKPLPLDIIKVDEDNHETKLQGAVFTLKKIDESRIGNSVTYDEQFTAVERTTGSDDGYAHFESIRPGYYEVKETTMPDGYVLTENAAFYIRVGDTIKLIEADLTKEPPEWKEVETSGNVITFTAASTDPSTSTATPAAATVKNKKGAALPSTGGPGTNLIYLFGIMLTCLAGTGLMIKRRKGITT